MATLTRQKLSTEFPDQKEMESDEDVLKTFMKENKYASKGHPSPDDKEMINAFVEAEAHDQMEIPRMRQLCNNMAMEFFVEADTTEWIYLTNKSSENADDEEIIKCKSFKAGDKAIAVFEVGESWNVVTPYAASENGFVAGQMISMRTAPKSDEDIVAQFLRSNPAANPAAPTEEEIEQINSFVMAEDGKADIICSQVCEGMCMEFSCEGAEMIYLTNKDGDSDETVVACKEGSKAVFEVMDGWNTITPYAFKKEEATQGEEIFLADEEDSPDFEQMSKSEISDFYANIEPAYEKAAFKEDKESFMVSKMGSKLMITMGIPCDHLWARAANGELIGASQFEETEDPADSAEFDMEDGISSVRIYAFTQDADANSMTIGAEYSL